MWFAVRFFLYGLCFLLGIINMQAKEVTDLSSVDFRNQIIKLDKNWEFYWLQILEPGEFSFDKVEKAKIISLPQTWKIPGKGFMSRKEGYATYRLHIKLPEEKTSYGIFCRAQSTAFRIYVDGQLLHESGKVGKNVKDSIPSFLPAEVFFTPRQQEVEILIQVSNFDFRVGGIRYPIYIGKQTKIVLNTLQ